MKRRFYARIDLRHDQADNSEIDETFRSGVELHGTNLWVLIFAIFIASIGLNVNSTAVIIGAMLISPLMGPIMALGYGAGVNDSALMRSSLFNLGLAALLSLLASTAYFLISPLAQAHSELLARTTPSIWDVLIALFGGLAGVIGATRKVKSNLIPGVAIATALMPPLCTAGYGLATGNWDYFFGALYLFAINCVFIAIATLMMVRLLRLPSVNLLEERSLIKHRTVIGIVVLLTLVPSLFLAINLVQKEWFETNGARFVQDIFRAKTSILVLSYDADFKTRQIRINLAGDRLPEADLQNIQKKLPEFGLDNTALLIAQSGQVMPDINAVKTDILREFLQTNHTEIVERDGRIATLQNEVQDLRKSTTTQPPMRDIYREIHAQFPQALKLNVTLGYRTTKNPVDAQARTANEIPILLVQITLAKPLGAAEKERLRLGLRVRAGLAELDDVRLEVSVAPIPKNTRKSRNIAVNR